jgi:hypothetical protein
MIRSDTCCDCGGRHLHGEPMHVMKITEYNRDGPERRTEYRCRECAERHARDWWCEEDQGPCPWIPMPHTTARVS